MEFFSNIIHQLTGMNFKKVQQFVTLVIVIGSALSIWKSLILIGNTQGPIVVVLTGSMEPGYFRGDLLFVTHWSDQLIPGDHVVYENPRQYIPIVHRLMITQQKQNNDLYILTKGDNNQVDDRLIYPRGVDWLNRQKILGKIRGILPYMGVFTIWFNESMAFKIFVLTCLTLFIFLSKDPQ